MILWDMESINVPQQPTSESEDDHVVLFICYCSAHLVWAYLLSEDYVRRMAMSTLFLLDGTHILAIIWSGPTYVKIEERLSREGVADDYDFFSGM